MLIDFTFGNFRSFKEPATLSLIAAEGVEEASDPRIVNTFEAGPGLSLLRTVALYGANASGKSNLAEALKQFCYTVLRSADVSFTFDSFPFILNSKTPGKPIYFEITFLLDKVQYRYGFEVAGEGKELPFDNSLVVVSEWLYQAVDGAESVLFERGENSVEVTNFDEAAPLIKNGVVVRHNALLVSLSTQIGGELSTKIVNFLRRSVNVISGLRDGGLQNFTRKCLIDGKYSENIIKLMQGSGTGITNIILSEDESDVEVVLPKDVPDEDGRISKMTKEAFKVRAEHPVYDDVGEFVKVENFPLAFLESEGTKKLFSFAGPIFDTLTRGTVLVVDEMDARFHPLMTRTLLQFFQSRQTNPKNAQLIFMTHDTNLLDKRIFRRDQIWFVEKDRLGASHLYSLSDFQPIAHSTDGNEVSFEEDYIRGRFGAIPFLGGLERMMSSTLADKSSAEAATPDAEGLVHAKP